MTFDEWWKESDKSDFVEVTINKSIKCAAEKAWYASLAKQWQPIETAPRDATAVLLMRNIWPGTKSGKAEKCNGHNTYVAEWWANDEGEDGKWVCYMDAVSDPDCPIQPTHWMSLPEPPKE